MTFTPAPPQQIMIDHLRRVPNALCFVGLGIGKTASMLYRLSEMFLNGEAVAALVLAPLRVINLTWKNEIEQWSQFSWMKWANLRTEHGQCAFLNGKAHIYGINFESIPSLVSLVERRRGTIPYDVLVIDESTKCKNPSSKRVNLFRRKVPRVERNWAATGTPVPNNNRELFAQARLVDGGARLGTSYTHFLQEYFHVTTYSGFPKYEEKNGAASKLEAKLADITVTLKSSDWLDLPDQVVEDVEIQFDRELMDKYKTLEKELIIELRQGKTINVASAAALVTKLLQFTSGEVYYDEKKHHPIHNLKFEALKGVVKKEGNLLIAYIFKHEEARLREQFPEAKFFADAKNETQQQQLLKDWNAKKIKMLCAHPASIAHGINLQHGGNAIVWISRTYSREMTEQFIARLWRRGQKDVVKVYYLHASGTVDDAVAEALATKASNEARLISALQMLEQMRNGGGK